MVQKLLQELIIQHLGPVKKSRKGWLTRNCMLCHLSGESRDTRGRFGVLFSPDGKIAAHCFNCGYDAVWSPGQTFSKKFIRFLKEIGVSQYDIRKLNFELFKEQNAVESSNDIQLRGIITKNWKPMALPKDSRTLQDWADQGCTDPNFLQVADYALNRGFTNFRHVYWTPDKEYTFNKRLLLPFWFRGEIVGYTGRYFGKTPNKSVPKYLNRMPENYIYNLSNQYGFEREYVILCEGVFDAYFVDGISSCHNTLDPEQAQIIKTLGKKVIVCPDRDKAGDTLVEIAVKEGWRVAFPEWGDGIKDAAEATRKYGRILTLRSIIDSSERNPTKIQLKWKMSKNDRH
jgi:hypothetical protein